MNSAPRSEVLDSEEYVEQAHFFESLGERLREDAPAQEVLASVREEVLATTKLPMAIDFMLAELRHTGMFGPAMVRLPHYFTPFQTFVVEEAENERRRFDLRVGLEILQHEAVYRASEPPAQGLFLYQFETICRNRLGYDRGLAAVAADPAYDAQWRDWILTIRRQVGMVDIADLIYVHSKHYMRRAAHPASRWGRPSDAVAEVETPESAQEREAQPSKPHAVLFGEREGRIALANRKKDPLLLFNSLHRQLGYPAPPKPAVKQEEQLNLAQIARRLEQLEKRITLMEEDQRGGLDLTKFYEPPRGPA